MDDIQPIRSQCLGHVITEEEERWMMFANVCVVTCSVWPQQGDYLSPCPQIMSSDWSVVSRKGL